LTLTRGSGSLPCYFLGLSCAWSSAWPGTCPTSHHAFFTVFFLFPLFPFAGPGGYIASMNWESGMTGWELHEPPLIFIEERSMRFADMRYAWDDRSEGAGLGLPWAGQGTSLSPGPSDTSLGGLGFDRYPSVHDGHQFMGFLAY